MKEKINLNDNPIDIAEKMCEGNPGALRVICEMIARPPNGLFVVLDLDDMNIRGERVWLGYKDHCGEDLDKFMQLARTRDAEMVETINNNCSGDERAVTSGASYAPA